MAQANDSNRSTELELDEGPRRSATPDDDGGGSAWPDMAPVALGAFVYFARKPFLDDRRRNR